MAQTPDSRPPISPLSAPPAPDARSIRVNELIGKMTALSRDSDDSALADFKPIGNPEPLSQHHSRQPASGFTAGMGNMYGPTAPSAKPPSGPLASNFAPGLSGSEELSGYRQSYELPPIINDGFYHTRRGGGGDNYRGNGGDNARLMEKINYMIHMMEEQQHEKTDHVAEEFILYTFLGVFIIFTVDSFSRIGKYTR